MRRILYNLAIAFICVSCGSPVDEFNEAVSKGSLSEAEDILKSISGGMDKYRCAEVLIDEYLSVDELDKSIYVYERITSDHCSRYEMKYKSLYSHDGYEVRVTEKLRKSLLKSDRFEEAWQYYPLEYENPDYAGNGSSYFRYLSDVIVLLCSQGRKVEANLFLSKNVHWFLSNVDNGEYGKSYPQYSFAKMKSQLQEIINTY